MWETWVQSLGWEDPLEKGKATLFSILAWRIPTTVQSMESQRVGHDWATFTFLGNYASQKIRYMYIYIFFNFHNRKLWKKGNFFKRRKNGQKMWVCHSMYPTRFILIFFFFFASNSFSSLWFTVESQVSKLGSQSAAATRSSNTNPIKPTSAKALFSTQRAPARVHQIWEESPSSRGLIHRDLHWFGHSEKQNLRQQSIHTSPFFFSHYISKSLRFVDAIN